MSDEEFYDTEIAPVLLELGRKCRERNMAFFAAVEFTTPEIGVGKTFLHEGCRSGDMTLILLAGRAGGNFDRLAISAAKLEGSENSVVLHMLEPKEDI